MKLDWIKTIHNFKAYFNKDHSLIIDLIGIDDYLKLYETFSKTGIYFSPNNNDRHLIEEIIGADNYIKLFSYFGNTGIYFSSTSIVQLKKVWAKTNRHIAYYDAARTLEVSEKSIYNWRNETRAEITQ